jgi:hypothetical protein
MDAAHRVTVAAAWIDGGIANSLHLAFQLQIVY